MSDVGSLPEEVVVVGKGEMRIACSSQAVGPGLYGLLELKETKHGSTRGLTPEHGVGEMHRREERR